MKTDYSFERLTRRNVKLAGHSSYSIGGEADYFAAPASTGELFFLLDYAKKNSLPYYVFGLGANILFPDRPEKGLLFITLKNLVEMEYKDGQVYFSCGVPLSFLALFGAVSGRKDLAFTHLLPGTIGAGLYMNAKCYDREISQVVSNVHYTDPAEYYRSVKPLSPEGCCFGYKKSVFQGKNWIILGAELEIPESGKDSRVLMEDLLNKVRKSARSLSPLGKFHAFFHREYKDFSSRFDPEPFEKIENDRSGKKHFDYPSCGSVFKNDRALGAPMGLIIDQLGLKGLSHGGAMVSPYHGNIIINYKKAAAADVIYLIQTLSEKIREKHGIEPEKEVIIL